LEREKHEKDERRETADSLRLFAEFAQNDQFDHPGSEIASLTMFWYMAIKEYPPVQTDAHHAGHPAPDLYLEVQRTLPHG
jgi:hypothetical protein